LLKFIKMAAMRIRPMVSSSPTDAVAMLRESVRLAREERRAVVFVEPIALYMTRDLHAEGDGLWTSIYEPAGAGASAPRGAVGVEGEGADLAVATYGNGFYLPAKRKKLSPKSTA
jgi:2-oxoisovalerate dehydrogenase E1 component